MATRRERIVLDVEDNASLPIARVAAAAKLLDKSLKDVDGAHIKASQSTRQLGNDVDKTSTSFKRGESSLNQFTGRLATMARAAALVGPAVVPLTAGMIPALAGMTAGLGAAAGALGVTLLAVNGLGKGLKALNQYQLEPSAANAQKLREEFDKLGPAGEHFVRYLDSLGPQMRELQDTAREGLLPGVEDGIDAMLTRLPQVQRIIGDIATEMGSITADAGGALAGGRFDSFFNYLDREAAPILRDFATATGNVVETFANLLVGVDPLTDSFTTGLVNSTSDLAEWSRNLDESEGFQNFLDYALESGPKVADLLGSLATTLAAIGQAAAPVGDIVLPALTGISDAIGAIARSDFGPVIFGTIAAMSALTTATRLWGSVAASSAGQFVAGQTAAAGAAGRTRAAMGAGGAAGAGVRGVGAAAALVGLTAIVTRYTQANDEMEASVSSAWDAIDRGDRGGARQGIADLEAMTDELERLTDLTATDSIGDFFDLDSWQAALNPAVGRNLIEGLFGKSEVEEKRAELEALRNEMEFLTATGGGTGDALNNLLGGPLDVLAGKFEDAALAGETFENMLADVNATLTKRSDWRAYQESIDAVTESLKQNGRTHSENTEKGRANSAALDQFAASTSKWAAGLEDVGRKARFLERSRDQFVQFARAMGYGRQEAQALADKLIPLQRAKVTPKVDLDTSTAKQREAEIRRLLTKLGLKRTDPEVGANITGYLQGDREVLARLQILDRKKANPTVTANTGAAQSNINAITSSLNAIPRSVTSNIYVNRHEFNSQSVAGRADGGTIYGPRQPYGDKVLTYLAPGEEVISNRYGQADRNRDLLKAINANRMAGGGTVPIPRGMQRASAPRVVVNCGHGRSGGASWNGRLTLRLDDGRALGAYIEEIADGRIDAAELMGAEVERAG